VNSITPGEHDLDLDSVTAVPSNGITLFDFIIVNVGLSAMTGAELRLYYDNNRDTVVTLADLIRITNLPDFNPGDTFHVLENLQLEGTYPAILVQLSADDRSYNNTRLVTVPGVNFPPIVINEFLADPKTPLGSEWIELRNRSDSTFNLQGWLLGDSNTLSPVSANTYQLPAAAYLVLCQDSGAFRSFYPDRTIPLLEISSWAQLNNNGDIIRLIDNPGYVADRFQYYLTFGGNYTGGRGGESGRENDWGKSKVAGGSPGSNNDVFYQAISANIRVTAEPNPFSPSRGEETVISFTVPPGENLAMNIYDLQGRKVKSLVNSTPAMDGTISWNGKTDDGRILPAGIYILNLEISNAGHFKRTLVVAP